jgi:putative protease
MKLAVTPFNISSINELAETGADIFILGNNKTANRLVKSFSELEMKDAIDIASSLNKEVYVLMNIIAHHEDLSVLDEQLQFLAKTSVSGILFGDIAVYQIAKKYDLVDRLIYHPETLNTNYYDPIFWGQKGIKGLVIAKEITLEDMTEIHIQSPIELSIIGHGHLNMFHSRRPLIENFFRYNKEEYEHYIRNRNLRLVEEIRQESYPIFQDDHGTHIFREKALESFQEIQTLSNTIDVFVIDGIFKDTSYLFQVLSDYANLLNDYSIEQAKQISEKYATNHDSGFLYKKTVYDKF